MKQPMNGHLNQYQESLEQIQYVYKDCLKFGHGKIVVCVKNTSNGKREVHVEYGRNKKYIISLDEMKG